LKEIFYEYKEYPLYSSWAILLNTLSLMLPPLLLGYYFNSIIVGYYSLAHRVITVPSNLIGISIGKVFFPEASLAHKKGNLDVVTLNIFKRLLKISVTPIFLLIIAAPDLFKIVFGHEWLTAGVYLRLLALWIIFDFVFAPISTIYMVLGKQIKFLIFNIALFVIRIFSLFVGGSFFKDPDICIFLYGLASFVVFLLFTISVTTMAGILRKIVLMAVIKEILKGCFYAIIPFFILVYFDDSFLTIFITIILGVVFLLKEKPINL